MGRSYAGVLGTLGVAAAIVRGTIIHASVESTLLISWLVLMIFSVLGYVIGQVAGSSIETSVRLRLMEELEAKAERKSPEGGQ